MSRRQLKIAILECYQIATQKLRKFYEVASVVLKKTVKERKEVVSYRRSMVVRMLRRIMLCTFAVKKRML